METNIYTVHRKGGRGIVVVPDRFDLFALLAPPIWAIWHGLWLTLAAMITLVVVAAAINPLAASPVLYGLAFILALEGGAIRRIELRVRGWQEAGVVQAASEEGAEELYVTGRLA